MRTSTILVCSLLLCDVCVAQGGVGTIRDFLVGQPGVEVVHLELHDDRWDLLTNPWRRLGADVALGDIDGDGLCEFAAGAPDAFVRDPVTGVIAQWAGRAYVMRGSDQSVMANISHPDPILYGFFGSALEIADFDQDGYGDLAVTAQNRDGVPCSVVWVYYGPDLDRAQVAEQPISGCSATLTHALDVGDMDADGYPDLVCGNPYAVDANAAGAFFIYHGPDLSRVTTVLRPDPFFAFFGYSISVGDVNGDGHLDVASGDPWASFLDGSDLMGRVFVYFGPDYQTYDSFANPDGVKNIGYGQSTAIGDYNHDGVDDLAVGVSGAPNPDGSIGCVYIYWGPKLKKKEKMRLENPPDGRGGYGDGFGFVIESVDSNQDGIMDLVVGTPWSARTNPSGKLIAGEVNILHGPDLAQYVRILSPDHPVHGFNEPQIGYCVDFGDITGDGLVDVALGSPGANGIRGTIYYADLSALQPFASYRVPGELAAEPSMTLHGEGTPTPGGQIQLRVDGLPPSATGWLWIAERQSALAFFGESHGTPDGLRYLLLEPPWLTVPFDVRSGAPLSGSADPPVVGTFTIPDDPSLYGTRIRMQAFAFDPADPAGFRGSDGLVVSFWDW